MKWKAPLAFGILLAFTLQCATNKNITEGASDRVRQADTRHITSYHNPVKLEIGWIPYTEHRLVHTKKNEWKVVKDASVDTTSVMPMILLSYPFSEDSLWFDMNMENETLGRLLKHTLMTQQPISRPFGEYMEVSKCSNCHPASIDISNQEPGL